MNLKLTIFILVLLSSLLQAGTSLDVKIGYEDTFIRGRWTPIFLTASDPKPRNVTVDVRVPNSSNTVMSIHQTFAIGPEQQDFIVYAPLRFDTKNIEVTLRDASTGKFLASYPENPQPGNSYYNFANDTQTIIVTSGTAPVMRGVTQLGSSRCTVASIRSDMLPDTSIGYDSIDLLVLNSPQLDQFNSKQIDAILTWVRRGGSLIIWPGDQAISADSTFAQALPCVVGELSSFDLSTSVLTNNQLSNRFSKLSIRKLTPKADTSPISILENAKLDAVLGKAGYGKILVLPTDPSILQFNNGPQQFWERIVQQVLYTRPVNGQNQYYNYNDPAATNLNEIGQIAGVGKFGFGYVAMLLGAMMLIVGPIDWWVLKKLRKQPWTWITTTGWIALITCGAIYIGHFLRSGDLHFRSMTLIEQIDDHVIEKNHIALIYAPSSNDYEMKSPSEIWWQPVGRSDSYYSNGNYTTPTDFHQDLRGNQSLPMWIDVWNYRFLQGLETVSEPPMLEAVLQLSDGHLTGSIRNLSNYKLDDIKLFINNGGTVSDGFGMLEAGKELKIDWKPKVSKKDPNENTMPVLPDYIHGAPENNPEMLFAIDPLITSRVNDLMRDKDQVCIIYANIINHDSSLSLTDIKAVNQHFARLRTVVTFK